MKNKLLSILMGVVLLSLSGCMVPGDEEVKADMDQMFSEMYPAIEFNYDDFRPEPSGCYKVINPYACSGPNELSAYYEPTEGSKYFSLYYDFVIHEQSTLEVMTAYYADYIYNDYLYDESLGNNVDEMFREFDRLDYKYYIDTMYISNTSLYDTIEKNSNGVILTSPIYIKDEDRENAHEGEDYVAYVEGRNVEDIDFHDYMEFMSYYPVLTVYIDAKNSNLSEDEVKAFEEEMKSYYDSEAMHIYFYSFDRKDSISSQYLFMDAEEGIYNIVPEGEEPDQYINKEEPVFNW